LKFQNWGAENAQELKTRNYNVNIEVHNRPESANNNIFFKGR